VIAAGQNDVISCNFNYTVPKGTPQVGLEAAIKTDEFPVYTGQQSQYNDAWAYNFSFPGISPAPLTSKDGKVNATHYRPLSS